MGEGPERSSVSANTAWLADRGQNETLALAAQRGAAESATQAPRSRGPHWGSLEATAENPWGHMSSWRRKGWIWKGAPRPVSSGRRDTAAHPREWPEPNWTLEDTGQREPHSLLGGWHGGAAAGGQAGRAVSHKVNVLLLTTQQPCSSGLTQRSWKLTSPEKSARGCLQRPHSQVPNLEAAQVPLSRWWVNKLGPSRQWDITQG